MRSRARRPTSPSRGGTGTQRAEQPETVESRHHDVAQHQIGPTPPCRLKRRFAIADRLDVVSRGEQAA